MVRPHRPRRRLRFFKQVKSETRNAEFYILSNNDQDALNLNFTIMVGAQAVSTVPAKFQI